MYKSVDFVVSLRGTKVASLSIILKISLTPRKKMANWAVCVASVISFMATEYKVGFKHYCVLDILLQS
jgi:hypothetical protein